MTDKKPTNKKKVEVVVEEPPKIPFKIHDQLWAVSYQIARDISVSFVDPVVDFIQAKALASFVKPHALRFMLSQSMNAVEVN